MKTIIEPFRIKSVEPLGFTSPQERQQYLAEAGHNLFLIRAEHVLIDLLTDSGTSAMSANQWAALMNGDESYAGARSFYYLKESMQDIMGFDELIPTHQGRAAETLFFSMIGGEGKIIPNNTHFDTTRANVEVSGSTALDLVIDEGRQPAVEHPFKGNMNIQALEDLLATEGKERVPVVLMTVTNNSGGGQPVSMQNIRECREVCRNYGIPFFIDACRFAENAYFIKLREEGYADKSVRTIAKEMFSYADGCLMSAKKDAFGNIGGFLALNDADLALRCRNTMVVHEGFPTYGGMTGRDMAAIAVGLQEILDERYLEYRIRSTQYVGKHLLDAGIPLIRPIGGHAVYLDAKAWLPHIPASQFPAQALACELYLKGGIRGVEIGSVMFGKPDPQSGQEIPAAMELVRLAIPRRVYTQSHMDYLIEIMIDHVKPYKDDIKGLEFTHKPEVLRHFTARFKQT